MTASLYSIFIGYRAGYSSTAASSQIGNNNIVIGTNITLPAQTTSSLNIGGVIFAKGVYSDTSTAAYSGSQFAPGGASGTTGKVGINKVDPSYTLHVEGDGYFQNTLVASAGLYAGGVTITGSLNIQPSSSAQLGSVGTATLVAGNKVVNNQYVTANSIIFLTAQTANVLSGYLRVASKVAGSSFAVSSSNASDTNTFAYMIIN